MPQLSPLEKLKQRLEKLPGEMFLTLTIVTDINGDIVIYGFKRSEEYVVEAMLEPIEENSQIK
jgi:hypothetical protein